MFRLSSQRHPISHSLSSSSFNFNFTRNTFTFTQLHSHASRRYIHSSLTLTSNNPPNSFPSYPTIFDLLLQQSTQHSIPDKLQAQPDQEQSSQVVKQQAVVSNLNDKKLKGDGEALAVERGSGSESEALNQNTTGAQPSSSSSPSPLSTSYPFIRPNKALKKGQAQTQTQSIITSRSNTNSSPDRARPSSPSPSNLHKNPNNSNTPPPSQSPTTTNNNTPIVLDFYSLSSLPLEMQIDKKANTPSSQPKPQSQSLSPSQDNNTRTTKRQGKGASSSNGKSKGENRSKDKDKDNNNNKVKAEKLDVDGGSSKTSTTTKVVGDKSKPAPNNGDREGGKKAGEEAKGGGGGGGESIKPKKKNRRKRRRAQAQAVASPSQEDGNHHDGETGTGTITPNSGSYLLELFKDSREGDLNNGSESMNGSGRKGDEKGEKEKEGEGEEGKEEEEEETHFDLEDWIRKAVDRSKLKLGGGKDKKIDERPKHVVVEESSESEQKDKDKQQLSSSSWGNLFLFDNSTKGSGLTRRKDPNDNANENDVSQSVTSKKKKEEEEKKEYDDRTVAKGDLFLKDLLNLTRSSSSASGSGLSQKQVSSASGSTTMSTKTTTTATTGIPNNISEPPTSIPTPPTSSSTTTAAHQSSTSTTTRFSSSSLSNARELNKLAEMPEVSKLWSDGILLNVSDREKRRKRAQGQDRDRDRQQQQQQERKKPRDELDGKAGGGGGGIGVAGSGKRDPKWKGKGKEQQQEHGKQQRKQREKEEEEEEDIDPFQDTRSIAVEIGQKVRAEKGISKEKRFEREVEVLYQSQQTPSNVLKAREDMLSALTTSLRRAIFALHPEESGVANTSSRSLSNSTDSDSDPSSAVPIRIEPFGSSRTGLSTATSDVDICLCDDTRPNGCNTRQDSKARSLPRWYRVVWLANVLRHSTSKGTFKEVFAIPGAGVPICKFVYHHRNGVVIQGDINVNERFGIYNSDLLKKYFDLSPIARPMAVFIKFWAKTRGLNDPAGGDTGVVTFSSYALLLMIVRYLQHVNALPNLQDEGLLEANDIPPRIFFTTPRFSRGGRHNIFPRGFDVTFSDSPPKGWEPNKDITLEDAIAGFFEYYSMGGEKDSVDFSREVISIKAGDAVTREGEFKKKEKASRKADTERPKDKTKKGKEAKKLNETNGDSAVAAQGDEVKAEGDHSPQAEGENQDQVTATNYSPDSTLVGMESSSPPTANGDKVVDPANVPLPEGNDTDLDEWEDEEDVSSTRSQTPLGFVPGIQPSNWSTQPFVIQDPFLPERNCTGNIVRGVAQVIVQEFARAGSIVRNGGSLEELCSRPEDRKIRFGKDLKEKARKLLDWRKRQRDQIEALTGETPAKPSARRGRAARYERRRRGRDSRKNSPRRSPSEHK